MLSVMSVSFSLTTVIAFFFILGKNCSNCFPSISYVIFELMKTCFYVLRNEYLMLIQNQIIGLKVFFIVS